MTKSVIGVIQARMGSSRLPGKALTPLAGKPLLWHMVDRMRRVEGIDDIILATTADPRNEALVEFAESEGLRWCRFPKEDDLAGRISMAIRDHPANIVLKTGGDCPLIDPAVLQKMIDRAREEDHPDFVSNRIQWSYPLGLSADVVSRHAVEWCDAHLKKAKDRELFALYIRDHPERFKVVPILNDENLSHLGWTVDEPDDLVEMSRIFDALYKEGECFSMHDVLSLLGKSTNQ